MGRAWQEQGAQTGAPKGACTLGLSLAGKVHARGQA